MMKNLIRKSCFYVIIVMISVPLILLGVNIAIAIGLAIAVELWVFWVRWLDIDDFFGK